MSCGNLNRTSYILKNAICSNGNVLRKDGPISYRSHGTLFWFINLFWGWRFWVTSSPALLVMSFISKMLSVTLLWPNLPSCFFFNGKINCLHALFFSATSNFEYLLSWTGKSNPPLSVDALEKMMEDPTVQKMVYP